MPATNGFIGELFVLIGAYKAHWFYALPVVFGVLLGTVYLLWMFQRIFLGDLVLRGQNPLKDLGLREIITVVPIICLIFWIGLYPRPFLQVTDASLNHLVRMVAANSRQSMAAYHRSGNPEMRVSHGPGTYMISGNHPAGAEGKVQFDPYPPDSNLQPDDIRTKREDIEFALRDINPERKN
jgi:formate hydrogenlyase subunit 3/multisubunit Na+/H+ antiporter MnhD subunit